MAAPLRQAAQAAKGLHPGQAQATRSQQPAASRFASIWPAASHHTANRPAAPMPPKKPSGRASTLLASTHWPSTMAPSKPTNTNPAKLDN